MRWPFVSRETHEAGQRTLMQHITHLYGELSDAQSRYDNLIAEVLRRGLKDEKEPAPVQPDEKPLPDVILKALGQWPEGTPPYVANRNYAFAQLAVRPDDAEGIALEITQGEDVEAYI